MLKLQIYNVQENVEFSTLFCFKELKSSATLVMKGIVWVVIGLSGKDMHYSLSFIVLINTCSSCCTTTVVK